MRGRCRDHDLAVGPDGLCVLCRRSHVPVAMPSSSAVTVVVIPRGAVLGTLGVIVALGSAGWFVAARRDRLPASAVAPPIIAEPDVLDELPEVASPPPPSSRVLIEGIDAFSPPPIPSGAELPGAMALPPSEPSEDARPREQANRLAAERSAEHLRLARKRVAITMYSTSWCGYCKRARDYMNAQGIHFEERDVEASPLAKQLHRQLSPKGGVPTFEIDGSRLQGFRPEDLERAIDAAAQRRVAQLF